jgi:hypothetical protein
MDTFGNDTKERKFDLASTASRLFCSYIGHYPGHFREVPDLLFYHADEDDLRFSDEKTPLSKSSIGPKIRLELFPRQIQVTNREQISLVLFQFDLMLHLCI